LRLYCTQITDAGLEHLKRLNKLKWLSLDGTQVTDAGVKKLKQALPNCQISFPQSSPLSDARRKRTRS